jgi:phosphatidylserine/phosphatidylglycerophosphate/cardiolipin synthase-like enzyme
MELNMKRKIMKSFKWIFVLGLAAGFYEYSPAQIAGFKNFEIVESAPVETTLDNPDVRNAHEVWLEMIGHAKRNLDLEQYYISNEPNEPLEDIIMAVVEAGKRGVKVRIIADAGMYKTYSQTLDMLGKQKNISVRLIDYGKMAGGIEHAKYFIVDGEEVFLESQNFDRRALKHIYKLGVHITDKRAAKTFTDIFEMDWELFGPESNNFKVHKERLKVPYVLTGGGGYAQILSDVQPHGLYPRRIPLGREAIGELDGSSESGNILSCLDVFSDRKKEGLL